MSWVRSLALEHTSGLALGFRLNEVQPLHELTYQTAMLKAGLRLGFIKTQGNA